MLTLGVIAQMCCPPRASVNEGVEGEGHWFIMQQPFSLQNLRVKFYKEGDWISEMKLAKGR